MIYNCTVKIDRSISNLVNKQLHSCELFLLLVYVSIGEEEPQRLLFSWKKRNLVAGELHKCLDNSMQLYTQPIARDATFTAAL